MSERMLSDEILLGLIKKNSGGGGGTDDYNKLKNQPKIENVTLEGDMTAADLGLATAAALAGKQDVLTAGDDLTFNGNTLNVEVSVPYIDEYDLSTDGNGWTVVTKKHKGEVVSTNTYQSGIYATYDIDGCFTLTCGGSPYWQVALTKASTDDPVGTTYGWSYGETPTVSSISFELAETGTASEFIADLNDALAGKQDTLTFDDVPTDNSNNPVKSNGIYDALALKQNATDNSLETETKTIVGAINEHEGDVSTLKSGLTTLDNEVNGDATVYPYADVITIPDAIPANIADCTVKIEPVQSGSGDPSPTNVRPITGHTEASVQRDGKNWFDGVKYLEGQYYQNGTKYVNANYDVYKYVLPVGNYVIKHIDSTTGLTNMVLCIDTYDSNGDILNYYQTNYNSGNPAIVQFSVDAETAYVYVSVRKSAEQVQLEIGTQPTPYAPYAGKTYTIALGDTIYGGTVDFDSGVMTVDRKLVDLGDYTWVPNGNDFYTSGITDFAYNMSDIGNIKRCPYYISDKYPNSSTAPNIDLFFNTGYSGYRCFVNGDTSASGMTGAEFKEYVTGTHLCYELATPTTIQLTPQQIQLLKGTNTITASTGQISVTVNGVSGSIGAVQTQANATDAALAELTADIADKLPTAPTTDGAYVLTVTVADGTPTYSWESAD